MSSISHYYYYYYNSIILTFRHCPWRAATYLSSFSVVYIISFHVYLARASVLCACCFYICVPLVDVTNSIACLISFGCPRSDGTFIFPALTFLLNTFLASLCRVHSSR